MGCPPVNVPGATYGLVVVGGAVAAHVTGACCGAMASRGLSAARALWWAVALWASRAAVAACAWCGVVVLCGIVAYLCDLAGSSGQLGPYVSGGLEWPRVVVLRSCRDVPMRPERSGRPGPPMRLSWSSGRLGLDRPKPRSCGRGHGWGSAGRLGHLGD
jgi:hypothetical protein